MKKTKKLKLPKLKLGGDPEFALSGSNNRFTFDHMIKKVGHIGSDHGGDVGELRPRLGSPMKIVQNLRKMMVIIKEHRPDDRLHAGGGSNLGKSTGGHIHFGIKISCRLHDSHHYSNCYGGCRSQSEGFKSMIRALDHFLGRPMRKHKGGTRNSRQYGQLGDIRSKRHGFEYRTPPSWLTSPEFAQSVLTVAHAIGSAYLINNEFWTRTFTSWSKTRKRIVLGISDIELLKRFSQEKDHFWLDQYITFMRDRSFDLGEAGTIERWLENKGS